MKSGPGVVLAYKDKTIWWLSSLYNGNPHTWKGYLCIEMRQWASFHRQKLIKQYQSQGMDM